MQHMFCTASSITWGKDYTISCLHGEPGPNSGQGEGNCLNYPIENAESINAV